MEDERRLEDIVRAIAAGDPVDWSAAESKAVDESSRAALRDLKIVSHITRFHRALHESTDESAPENVSATAASNSLPRPWGPLTLVERVGGGCFADVYRAWDSRLDREVALKLLRHTDTLGESAIVPEGRLMARVTHANIVAVHGADVVNGQVGIWMEFIHGRTLESNVRDHGPYASHEAASIGIAVCRALTAVHRAGLVHCDVKAQNVMREDSGRVVLMDFGAGQLMQGGGSSLGGTPLYIAPEVLEGSRPTAQSDVYSLGVLLYYLAANRYPVEGCDVARLRVAHRRGERAPLREIRPDVPRRFSAVVERALETDAAKRFQTTEEFEAALERTLPVTKRRRWLAMAASVVVTLGLGFGARATWPRPSPALQPSDWILVGPFENRTGDARLDGTIEYAFERELANSSPLAVVPRDRIDDALRLMQRPLDTRLDLPTAREVCLRDGGIAALITGRIERVGSQFVVTSEVVAPGSGAVVASRHELASTSEDLLAAVRRSALELRQALGEKASSLDTSRRELEGVTTPSLEALRAYSRAAALMRGPGTDKSPVVEQYLREALDEDPHFASAHVLLAWVLRNQGRPKEEYLPHAEEALRLAAGLTKVERLFIEASRQHLEGLGTADQAVRVRDFDAAATQYEMVLHEQPNHYWAAENAQFIYYTLDRIADRNEMLQRLARMRPNDFDLNAQTAMALFGSGDTSQAAPYAARAAKALAAATTAGLSEAPGSPDAFGYADPAYAAFIRVFPAYAAWQRGDVTASLRAADRSVSELGTLNAQERSLVAARAAEMYATLGRLHRAREVASLIPDSVVRDRTNIHFLWLSGDTAGLREALLALRGPKDAVAAMMTEAGMIADCKQLLATTRAAMLKSGGVNDPVGTRYVTAFETRLAFAERRYMDAAGFSDRFTAGLPQGPRPVYELVTAENLADSLVELGELQRAIGVLETFSSYRLEPGIGTGYTWLRLRLNLARANRLAGRQREARLIESELVQLLAFADVDYPLLQRVRDQIAGRAP